MAMITIEYCLDNEGKVYKEVKLDAKRKLKSQKRECNRGGGRTDDEVRAMW